MNSKQNYTKTNKNVDGERVKIVIILILITTTKAITTIIQNDKIVMITINKC